MLKTCNDHEQQCDDPHAFLKNHSPAIWLLLERRKEHCKLADLILHLSVQGFDSAEDQVFFEETTVWIHLLYIHNFL